MAGNKKRHRADAAWGEWTWMILFDSLRGAACVRQRLLPAGGNAGQNL
jgi:hypothetical protein